MFGNRKASIESRNCASHSAEGRIAIDVDSGTQIRSIPWSRYTEVDRFDNVFCDESWMVTMMQPETTLTDSTVHVRYTMLPTATALGLV